jgi:hypothetical protein
MDFSVREKLIALCKIGTCEFPAVSVGGGGERRLAGGGTIGNDGEEFEDLGENARTEQIEAIVPEDVYLELEAIRREGKAVTCTHPLFGIFNARLKTLNYKADLIQGVSINLVLVEDGDHVGTALTPGSPQASGAATAALDAMSLELDVMALLPELPIDLIAQAFAAGLAVGGFLSALESAALGGTADVQTLSGAFGEFTLAANLLIDSFDLAMDTVPSLVDLDVIDLTLAAVDASRIAVEALVSASSTVWQPLSVASPLGLEALATERALALGLDPDDMLDRILASNPQIVDSIAIPSGATVWLPV